ncbi:MAG: FAD:protein FMN transferase [Oscillospiraceae bacterium]|nr:FAD:protein FMN transferase [Oscillospiraceae bacterium]
MRRILAVVLSLCLLAGCGATAASSNLTIYEASFLTLFDTVTTIKGEAESKEAFEETVKQIHDDLEYYHRLFDIYNDYEGINNIKTINDRAGVSPVEVDPDIIALLKDCCRYYEITGGKTNVAMGSVLRLWHDARSEGIDDPANASLPNRQKLEEAAEHTDIGSLVIDEAASTVFLTDPEARLDVGAVAKGWASQRVAEKLPSGMLLSVGGNVCATGTKHTGEPWVIGIRNPSDGSGEYLHTLYVKGGAVVTSGDYQRTYMVDGEMYHHIIDPETLMPSSYWRSVSVICEDSGLADALSTALFLLPLEEGRALAEECGVQVLWSNASGEEFMTPGFQEMIRT